MTPPRPAPRSLPASPAAAAHSSPPLRPRPGGGVWGGRAMEPEQDAPPGDDGAEGLLSELEARVQDVVKASSWWERQGLDCTILALSFLALPAGETIDHPSRGLGCGRGSPGPRVSLSAKCGFGVFSSDFPQGGGCKPDVFRVVVSRGTEEGAGQGAGRQGWVSPGLLLAWGPLLCLGWQEVQRESNGPGCARLCPSLCETCHLPVHPQGWGLARRDLGDHEHSLSPSSPPPPGSILSLQGSCACALRTFCSLPLAS